MELRLSLRLQFLGKMLFMYLGHVQAGGGAEGRGESQADSMLSAEVGPMTLRS